MQENHSRFRPKKTVLREMKCTVGPVPETSCIWMDAVIEPERLAQISLGQENPRMRMNAAPG